MEIGDPHGLRKRVEDRETAHALRKGFGLSSPCASVRSQYFSDDGLIFVCAFLYVRVMRRGGRAFLWGGVSRSSAAAMN